MKRLHTAALALAGALAFTAPPAVAETVSGCIDLIEALRTETLATEFLGRNAEKDELALVGKLDQAVIKLDRAKLGDATQKIVDYKAKLDQLVGAGKVGQADYANLTGDANGVLTCIAGIQ